eukprot:295383_1
MSSTRSRSCKRKVKSRKSTTKSRRPRAKSLGSPKTKRRWFGIDLKHFGVTVSKSNAFLSYLDISNDATQPNKNANNNLDILNQIWNCLFHCRKIPVKIKTPKFRSVETNEMALVSTFSREYAVQIALLRRETDETTALNHYLFGEGANKAIPLWQPKTAVALLNDIARIYADKTGLCIETVKLSAKGDIVFDIESSHHQLKKKDAIPPSIDDDEESKDNSEDYAVPETPKSRITGSDTSALSQRLNRATTAVSRMKQKQAELTGTISMYKGELKRKNKQITKLEKAKITIGGLQSLYDDAPAAVQTGLMKRVMKQNTALTCEIVTNDKQLKKAVTKAIDNPDLDDDIDVSVCDMRKLVIDTAANASQSNVQQFRNIEQPQLNRLDAFGNRRISHGKQHNKSTNLLTKTRRNKLKKLFVKMNPNTKVTNKSKTIEKKAPDADYAVVVRPNELIRDHFKANIDRLNGI